MEKKQFLSLRIRHNHVLNCIQIPGWIFWKLTLWWSEKSVSAQSQQQQRTDMIIKITVCPGQFIEGLRNNNKKKDQKQSACKIRLFFKCLPRNQQTNAPTMALFHTFPPIPQRVPTQATSHSEIHPGDLSCPALMLRHLVAPTPLPSRGRLQHWQGRKCICFRFPTLQQPSPPQVLLFGMKEENKLMCQFPSLCSGVVLVLPTSAHSALLDLTFPIHCLSSLMEKPGQVLTSFLVGHREEIKAQAKPLPRGALFTFLIVSHTPASRHWEHGFAFYSTLKNSGTTTEKNLNKVHWSCWEKKGASLSEI